MTRSLLFQELAEELTVGRICERWQGEVDLGNPVEHALSLTQSGEDKWRHESTSGFLLVREQGKTVGLLYGVSLILNDVESSPRSVRDLVHEVPATNRILDTAPFSKALQHFKTNTTPYFVENGSETVGVLTLNSIVGQRPMFCYLALTLDLENAALDLCTHHPRKAWNSLDFNRREDAWDRYMKAMAKHRRIEHEFEYDEDDEHSMWQDFLLRDALQFTYLADKRDMITGANLVIAPSNKVIKRVFERAQRIRNACAHCFSTTKAHPDRWGTHPSDLFDVAPSKLPQFVDDCLQMIEHIRSVT